MPRVPVPLSEYEEWYLIENGSKMTALQLSRALDFSITKVMSNLKRLQIGPYVKPVNSKGFKSHLSGLAPIPERKWIRPAPVYTNTRYIYPEIAEMAE